MLVFVPGGHTPPVGKSTLCEKFCDFISPTGLIVLPPTIGMEMSTLVAQVPGYPHNLRIEVCMCFSVCPFCSCVRDPNQPHHSGYVSVYVCMYLPVSPLCVSLSVCLSV